MLNYKKWQELATNGPAEILLDKIRYQRELTLDQLEENEKKIDASLCVIEDLRDQVETKVSNSDFDKFKDRLYKTFRMLNIAFLIWAVANIWIDFYFDKQIATEVEERFTKIEMRLEKNE